MGRKVLVTGSRTWHDEGRLFATLDALAAQEPIDRIVEGCAQGADQAAERWATARAIPNAHYPAEWRRYGRAAGPIRNRAMLTEQPDLVVAFHPDLVTSRGTADMVRAARRAGVPVVLIGGM